MQSSARQYDLSWFGDVKKKPEDVVAVMSGSLKSYFYVVCRAGTGMDTLQQGLEAFPVVGNGEHIGQNFAI